MKTTLALTVVAFLLGAWLTYERTAAAETEPAVLRVHALELVDEQGTKRASLVTQPQGGVLLYMWDEKGTIRVKLGAGRDGSGLLLANESTEVGVHLLATRARTWVALQRGAKRRVILP
jgi:hypothetical protein